MYKLVHEAVALHCPGWSEERIRAAILEFTVNGIKGDGHQVWHAIGNVLWEDMKK